MTFHGPTIVLADLMGSVLTGSDWITEHFYRVMDAATKISHANITNRMQITCSQRCYYVFRQTLTGAACQVSGWNRQAMGKNGSVCTQSILWTLTHSWSPRQAGTQTEVSVRSLIRVNLGQHTWQMQGLLLLKTMTPFVTDCSGMSLYEKLY